MSWTRFVPALYFRKWVAIENWRLWCVQTGSYFIITVGVLILLIQMPTYKYKMHIDPAVRYESWVDQVDHLAALATPLWCQDPSLLYDYRPDLTREWKFADAKCASLRVDVCANGASSCILTPELFHASSDKIFIATSFTDQSYNSGTSGPSPSQSFVIPGVEDIFISSHGEYQIDLPTSVWHSVFSALLQNTQLQGVLVDKNGKEIMKYKFAEKHTRATIRQLLDAAGVSLDDEVKGMLQEFPDNALPGKPTRPKLRVVGLNLILDGEISNQFGDADYQGPILKTTVRAIPSWSSHTHVSFTDKDGSTKTRSFSGITITTSHRGEMAWFQISKLVTEFSMYSVWLQVPILVVFYFSILCLGTLSDVFQGFTYEQVNLHQEFNGVSSRMLQLTFGFHDLHDLEEKDGLVWGCSKQRLQNRMDVILEHDKNLDVAERTQFTNYLFDITATTMPSSEKAIHLDDYRNPHMTNENLLFEDVLQIVDSDRVAGNILERLFMDDSLKEFSAEAEKAEAEIFGKKRGKRSKHFQLIGVSKLLEQARTQRTTKVMGRLNTIARARFGMDIVTEQSAKLEKAFDKMNETCDHIQVEDEEHEDGEQGI